MRDLWRVWSLLEILQVTEFESGCETSSLWIRCINDDLYTGILMRKFGHSKHTALHFMPVYFYCRKFKFASCLLQNSVIDVKFKGILNLFLTSTVSGTFLSFPPPYFFVCYCVSLTPLPLSLLSQNCMFTCVWALCFGTLKSSHWFLVTFWLICWCQCHYVLSMLF